MIIQFGAAKTGKYAAGESGDTLEMIERPGGGISFVLADGQRSGRSAKTISSLVTSKAISLLSEGIRDGAAARATHDYLFNLRGGKVSATLNIVSVDLATKTMVFSRNSHCPIIIQTDYFEQEILDKPSMPIGVHRNNKPQISEMPLREGTVAVIFTDGILSAGEFSGNPLDVPTFVSSLYSEHLDRVHVAQNIADDLMKEALARDAGRPLDDVSVLVLAVLDREADDIRRMSVTVPVPPLLKP